MTEQLQECQWLDMGFSDTQTHVHFSLSFWFSLGFAFILSRAITLSIISSLSRWNTSISQGLSGMQRAIKLGMAEFHTPAQGEQQDARCCTCRNNWGFLASWSCLSYAYPPFVPAKDTVHFMLPRGNEPWADPVRAKTYGSLPGTHGKKVAEKCWNWGFCY